MYTLSYCIADMVPKLGKTVSDIETLTGDDRPDPAGLVRWQGRLGIGYVVGIVGLFLWLVGTVWVLTALAYSVVGVAMVVLGAVFIFVAFLCSLVWLLLSVVGSTHAIV